MEATLFEKLVQKMVEGAKTANQIHEYIEIPKIADSEAYVTLTLNGKFTIREEWFHHKADDLVIERKSDTYTIENPKVSILVGDRRFLITISDSENKIMTRIELYLRESLTTIYHLIKFFELNKEFIEHIISELDKLNKENKVKVQDVKDVVAKFLTAVKIIS